MRGKQLPMNLALKVISIFSYRSFQVKKNAVKLLPQLRVWYIAPPPNGVPFSAHACVALRYGTVRCGALRCVALCDRLLEIGLNAHLF